MNQDNSFYTNGSPLLSTEPTDDLSFLLQYPVTTALETTQHSMQNEIINNQIYNISPYQQEWQEHSSLNATPTGFETVTKPKKTRRRRPVNCSFCRRRKLKCDRQHPCSNCVKRHIESTCTYASENSGNGSSETPPESTVNFEPSSVNDDNIQKSSENLTSNYEIPTNTLLNTDIPPHSTTASPLQQNEENIPKTSDIQKRIDRMQMMIMGMLEDKSISDSSYSSPSTNNTSPESIANQVYSEKLGELSHSDQIAESLGLLALEDNGEIVYHGDTHWVVLFKQLKNVEDLLVAMKITKKREIFKLDTPDSEELLEDEARAYAFPMLTRSNFNITKQDAINSIPPKHECDILLERFFNVSEPCFSLFNQSVFQKEYQNFWKDPSEIEDVWLAMLLLMLSISMQSYMPGKFPSFVKYSPRQTWLLWVDCAEALCFIGDFLNSAGLNSVRFGFLWIMARNNMSRKDEWVKQVAFFTTVLIRLCHLMGLHRDPDYFGLETSIMEERRNIWNAVQYMDIFISLASGVPAQVSPATYDVIDPLNLSVNDYETKTNNVQYPDNINPNVAFTALRSKLMMFTTKVLNDSTGIGESHLTYDQVWARHEELMEIQRNAPSFLSTDILTVDLSSKSLEEVLHIFWFQIDFQRVIALLHRVYGTIGLKDSFYENSTTQVRESCSRVLKLSHWFSKSEYSSQLMNQFGWFAWQFFHTSFLNAVLFNSVIYLCHYESYSPDIRQRIHIELKQALDTFDRTRHFSGNCPRVESMLKLLVSRVTDVAKSMDEDKDLPRKTPKNSAISPSDAPNFGYNHPREIKELRTRKIYDIPTPGYSHNYMLQSKAKFAPPRPIMNPLCHAPKSVKPLNPYTPESSKSPITEPWNQEIFQEQNHYSNNSFPQDSDVLSYNENTNNNPIENSWVQYS